MIQSAYGMNMEIQGQNRYSVAMYWKRNFNKIEQGFSSIMSDLDIVQGYTNSWDNNEQAGDYNEPFVLVTNERAGKVASAIW